MRRSPGKLHAPTILQAAHKLLFIFKEQRYQSWYIVSIKGGNLSITPYHLFVISGRVNEKNESL